MSKHVCDNRCRGESGHHAWPSPRPGECLCNNRLDGQTVWCPTHETSAGTPQTPMPSEGPYRVVAIGNSPYSNIVGPHDEVIEGSIVDQIAQQRCKKFNQAHSRALTSHSDAVRELVRAAKLSRSAISAVANEANWGFLKDADDALHSALSNPALRDAIKEVEEA